jgi:hypothetical protein
MFIDKGSLVRTRTELRLARLGKDWRVDCIGDCLSLESLRGNELEGRMAEGFESSVELGMMAVMSVDTSTNGESCCDPRATWVFLVWQGITIGMFILPLPPSVHLHCFGSITPHSSTGICSAKMGFGAYALSMSQKACDWSGVHWGFGMYASCPIWIAVEIWLAEYE